MDEKEKYNWLLRLLGSDAVFILCEAVALCNENQGTSF